MIKNLLNSKTDIPNNERLVCMPTHFARKGNAGLINSTDLGWGSGNAWHVAEELSACSFYLKKGPAYLQWQVKAYCRKTQTQLEQNHQFTFKSDLTFCQTLVSLTIKVSILLEIHFKWRTAQNILLYIILHLSDSLMQITCFNVYISRQFTANLLYVFTLFDT